MGKFVSSMRQPSFGVVHSVNKGSAKYRAQSERGETSMLSRLAGAFLRAILMIALIATPSYIVPTLSVDAALMTSFISLCAGVLIFFEYNARAPSFVEFRDAAPVNRLRFCVLFAIVFAMGMILRDGYAPTTLSRAVATCASVMADFADFPYSPIRLLSLALPAGSSPDVVQTVLQLSATAYVITLVGTAILIATLYLTGWPTNGRSFNLWVNMPTFEPVANGDTVGRLSRDANISMAIGFLLPFALPAIAQFSGQFQTPAHMISDQSLIWLVTGWAFLPASLFMRGVALSFVVRSISAQRKTERAADAEYSVV